MKVAMFVSNAFAIDRRVYAEATSLLKAGYEVTVIAWDRERQNPSRQNLDGIEVVRLRTRLLPKQYRFGYFLLVEFNLLLWQRQAYRQALILNREKRFAFIHCHDFDTLAIGTRLKRKLGLPLVYDAHEVYGYTMTRIFPHRIANIFLWLEKRLIRRVDKIINVCEPQKKYFERITDKPISLIMNCKPLQSLEYQPPDNQGDFTLLYIGGLHQGRAVLMLVQAVRGLPGVQCIIRGTGRPHYVQALKEECSRTSNVTFSGRVPFEEVIPMTKKSDVSFCMLNPADPNSVIGMPNKLYEAMVCGRPLICTKGTYSGEVTEQEEAGLVVEYSEQALREAIIKLRDNLELRERLGRNALKAAIDKYNWQKQEEKLIELYKSLQNESQLSG